MIIHVEDDNALSRELIKRAAGGMKGQVAEWFGFQQGFWNRTTLSGIKHNVALYSHIYVVTGRASIELQFREQPQTPRTVPVPLEQSAPYPRKRSDEQDEQPWNLRQRQMPRALRCRHARLLPQKSLARLSRATAEIFRAAMRNQHSQQGQVR
jgi:hypothetical protein